MSISKSALYLIEKYGDTVTLTQGESIRKGKAVIQPLMYKNKMYLGGTVTPVGYLDESHYIMTAPADFLGENPEDVIVTHRTQDYVVERCEIISAGDEDLYLWVVLETYSGEVEDGYL